MVGGRIRLNKDEIKMEDFPFPCRNLKLCPNNKENNVARTMYTPKSLLITEVTEFRCEPLMTSFLDTTIGNLIDENDFK